MQHITLSVFDTVCRESAHLIGWQGAPVVCLSNKISSVIIEVIYKTFMEYNFPPDFNKEKDDLYPVFQIIKFDISKNLNACNEQRMNKMFISSFIESFWAELEYILLSEDAISHKKFVKPVFQLRYQENSAFSIFYKKNKEYFGLVQQNILKKWIPGTLETFRDPHFLALVLQDNNVSVAKILYEANVQDVYIGSLANSDPARPIVAFRKKSLTRERASSSLSSDMDGEVADLMQKIPVKK